MIFLETNFISEHFETVAGLIIEKQVQYLLILKKQKIKIDNFVSEYKKLKIKKYKKY